MKWTWQKLWMEKLEMERTKFESHTAVKMRIKMMGSRRQRK